MTALMWITFCAALSTGPETVQFEGIIEHIHTIPGEGPPYLEVRHDGELTKVILGSMRYLLEQNFKPKTGDRVKVTGFRVDTRFYAARIYLPRQDKTLELRDSGGRPVWRGRGAMRR
jgi:hypothetical protein